MIGPTAPRKLGALDASAARERPRETSPGLATVLRSPRPSRFPHDFHDEVQRILIELHRDLDFKNVLGHGMVERFVPVGPETYEDIRMMVDACEAVGFTKIR
jgi:phosphonate transport system substrate-binding protein